MFYSKYLLILVAALLIVVVPGCKKEDIKIPNAFVTTDFESGSIGLITKLSNTKWELSLKDDNDNPDLPDSWRNWWYVKMDNLPLDSTVYINLKNRGWPYYYLPVYSYDQKEWHRFTEDQVVGTDDNELIMSKTFTSSTVWLARFYPYTYSDLETYLGTIVNSPYVEIDETAKSQAGKSIFSLKITDFNVPRIAKKIVLLHGRTHPAETPSSFLIEGLIDFLLAGSHDATQILANFEFHIFPMQNVDGVMAGNYRSTPQTENLEVMWFYDTENPLNLTDDAPDEVKIIHEYARSLMSGEGPHISMALNLHASNSEADVRPFFYPHFGTEAQGYDAIQASLWENQISFISSFATNYGTDMVEPIPTEGGGSFATKTYPESWWWVNYQDEVMAMTMEMTYGRAGYSPRWIEENDLRDMGSSLALGIRGYYDDSFVPSQFVRKAGINNYNRNLKYPELYPPNAVDESKK